MHEAIQKKIFRRASKAPAKGGGLNSSGNGAIEP
jgi:hypothetical protein